MFAEAKECGADAVKLQKRDKRALFTREYYGRPYDNPNGFLRTVGYYPLPPLVARAATRVDPLHGAS